MRTPSPRDAAAVWRLVRDSDVLDLNSPYAYLLLCSDFAQTSIVAEAAGHLLGFVGAYRRPPRPESVFVWQIVTAREAQRRGLASHLLETLLAQRACRGVRFLEATVTPSNHPSRAFFEGFARRLGVPFEEEPAFPAELFPGADHEDEIRVRIGPLSAPPLALEET
jgi:L-2,4-diaminobutyric acid acetyltransferase